VLPEDLQRLLEPILPEKKIACNLKVLEGLLQEIAC
jgi:hypothetical protein